MDISESAVTIAITWPIPDMSVCEPIEQEPDFLIVNARVASDYDKLYFSDSHELVIMPSFPFAEYSNELQVKVTR